MAGTRFGSGEIGTEAGGAHPSKTANLGLSLNGVVLRRQRIPEEGWANPSPQCLHACVCIKRLSEHKKKFFGSDRNLWETVWRKRKPRCRLCKS